MNHKKFIFIIIVVSLIVVLIHGAYKYVTEGSILGGTIFAFSLIIGNLINQITWGDPNGVSEESQDEMGQQITYKSSKIAYFTLVVVMFLILLFSEGFSMGANLDGVKNFPLFIALCSSFFIYPIIELIVAKQYK
ncbi:MULTISPECIES: hypothetical protein [Bacillus cereus group]|uniref:Group-specific protein n=1 Tax=Bacillus paranthracis TaxID=2026186 RepID=A0A9X8SQ40_9BACI|nr:MULTISPECIES: hypothetical protein [Bacillus cereus group]ONG66274.1 hypothetical protein BKK44_22030 [Bacillus cereus]MDA1988277.1 hypothetical protein [Bacillus cereus group sp. BcHK104]MDA2192623.1 hypothetical protein [Bacillus cereus group sp. Bc238]MDA2198245.1 hypothetical protein [Bacillus cereus group sp. Bc237]MDA2665490.1 hypothetical protein [Bacillus cereus group sp. Bc032]